MTLRIHVASHPDALVAMLCERLIAEPLDPFTPELVTVPTRGIERWLTQRIAQASVHLGGGISAHVEFPSPHALVRSIVAPVPELSASLAAWEGPSLQAEVMAAIDASLEEPWMALLRRHLTTPSASRMAAAAKITRLFSGYARRRPEMVAAWAELRDVGPGGESLGEHHRWQPRLWREVRRRIATPSPVELLPGSLDPIRAGAVALPERISVYGITAADPFDLAVLRAAAETTDVLVHVLHPSPALWDAVHADPPIDRGGAAERAVHPLLAGWGRHSRELQVVLVDPGTPIRQAPPGPERTTLLGRLQADIRANRPPSPSEADASIQIHVCHGARRQVEVLRDAILHVLAGDPTLEPRDVVIMTPDLATFAPLLEAGFPQGDGGGLPDLRVRIADRSPAATNPLVRFAAGILDLADGRLDAASIRELVTRPLVQQRFGFDADGARAVTAVIEDSSIAWGLDAEHRRWWGIDDIPDRTWARGVDRALAGVFYEDDPVRVVGGVAPLDGVEGQDARPVGILAAIVDRIAAIRQALSEPLPMSQWAATIAGATRALADPGWDGEWQWAQLERLLDETFPTAASDPAVTLAEARRAMAAWTDERPSPLHFRTGDVTVCTLAPMRSVPYRVVCLLGMDDDRFPRAPRTDGDDLLTDHVVLGDHDRSGEDRQLLLDAVMAAGDHLLITYSGRDEITNAAYPPAVPIAELEDVLAAMTGEAAGELETTHPLQSFSAEVFTDGALRDGGPWGFDPIQLAGSLAVQNRRQLSLVMSREWVGTEPPEVVRLDDLVQFLLHPVSGFVEASLGFKIPSVPELPDDALPVRLGPLAGWGLKARLLDGLSLGHDLDSLLERERAADRLPPGVLAEAEIERARGDVSALWSAAVARGYHQPRHEWFRHQIEVGGRVLEGLVQADPVECHVALVTPSRMKAAHRLRVFIQQVFLSAAQPELAWHGLVLARRPSGQGLQEALFVPIGSEASDRRRLASDLLGALLAIYDDGHRAPMALPCETASAWARGVGSSRNRAFRDAKVAFEGKYGPERDDAAFRLVFPQVTSLDHLLEVGFELHAARLWDLVIPYMKDRTA